MDTSEEIKAAIATLPRLSEEELIHTYKIITSMTIKKEKELHAPVLRAINKERRKRGTIRTISLKSAQVKVAPTPTADDYEAEEVIHDD